VFVIPTLILQIQRRRYENDAFVRRDRNYMLRACGIASVNILNTTLAAEFGFGSALMSVTEH
jgi:hypothetical protein